MTLKGNAFMWDFEEMRRDLGTTQVGMVDESGMVQWEKVCCTWVRFSQDTQLPVHWRVSFVVDVVRRKKLKVQKALAIAMPSLSPATVTKPLPKKYKDGKP